MSKELGTLVIVVLKAQHLIDNHTFYKQDPYVKLSLSGATKQTPVDPKGGQHPVWDAELRFPISKDPSKSNRTLTISVFSEEKKDDELLGEGSLDITDTLKSGEFDDWIPLSLKGTQRGDVYLEMTFFSAGPAPLTRRPTKFTNPAERLARPQQPVAQRPQRVVSQPAPSALSPGAQPPRVQSHEGSRQGRPKVQQVPLPGAWPGPSAQRQSTQPPASSHLNRRSSKSEDAPLPPLPQNAGPKEESVPSTLRPGGPSRTVAQPIHETRTTSPNLPAHDRYPGGAPSPPIVNGTAGHPHTMPSDSNANTTYPTHHAVNQTTLPYPGSPVPPAYIHSSSPQPHPQPQPHTPPLAPYSTHGSSEHVGVFSAGGHTTTQPSPHAQPEFTHAQYHSQPHPPPQQRPQVQHSPWQPAQPQGGQFSHQASPYPTDNRPAPPYVSTPGPPSPGQSHVANSSPTPPPYPYASQAPSPPAPSYITAQSPPPVPHNRPYAANPSPTPSARPHSTSPNLGASVPPTHQYSTSPSPIHPPQPYAGTPVGSAHPYTPPANSAPLAQPYVSPMGSVLSPPPQSAMSSPPVQPYISAQSPMFPVPTSPPLVPSHGPSYAPGPSFPMPSFPVAQSPGYFETVSPVPFSPPAEPDLPDPYLRRRYETPLPLPPGAPHPQRSNPNVRPRLESAHPFSAAAAAGSGTRRGEDERAAREWQRWEEESARARREQEERDAELARTLDLELNMENAESGRPSHSQLPRLSTGVVENTGGW